MLIPSHPHPWTHNMCVWREEQRLLARVSQLFHPHFVLFHVPSMQCVKMGAVIPLGSTQWSFTSLGLSQAEVPRREQGAFVASFPVNSLIYAGFLVQSSLAFCDLHKQSTGQRPFFVPSPMGQDGSCWKSRQGDGCGQSQAEEVSLAAASALPRMCLFGPCCSWEGMGWSLVLCG